MISNDQHITKNDQSNANLDDIKIEINPSSANTTAIRNQTTPTAAGKSDRPANRYVSSSPEPLPIFDCVYCAGLHEHLVLQTTKQKQLKIKYGQERTFNENKKEEDRKEEDNYLEFDRILLANMLKYPYREDQDSDLDS